jgi:NAD(P)-dependent dehydrogenase (short-subunit alcohol dehydrogenase family)
MSILLTGGAGYIGSHMAHELADAGERVVVLDDFSTGFEWAIPVGVPLVVGDVGDEGLIASTIAAHSVSAIVHFAASVVVPESVIDPLPYYRNNTMNSRNLIAAALSGGVQHFIFSSTAAVYGNPAKIPVAKDAPAQPMSPYGSSKLMTEIMLRDVGLARGLRYLIMRYFNVAGADPKLRTGQSTPGATHLIMRSRPRSACVQKSRCLVRTIRRRTVLAYATTSMSVISPERIRTRCAICAAGASRSRSIAAMAAASRCLRLSTRSSAWRAVIFAWSSRLDGPAIRRGSWRPQIAPESCSAGVRNLTTFRRSSRMHWHGSASFSPQTG